MYKSVSLLLVLCMMASANQRNSKQHCGTYLADALSAICGVNGYNSMIPHKRSSLDLLDPIDFIEDRESSTELLPYPLVNGRLRSLFDERLNSLTNTRRRQRRITDECCLKPCTVNEMMSYCRQV